MKFVIHPFPAPADNNMFLKLLYREVNGQGINNNQFEVQPQSLFRILKSAHREHDVDHIIHIHWEAVMYGSRYVLKSLALMLVNFSLFWFLKNFYGYKICWTMHNYRSHDYPHPKLDAIGQKVVFSLADGVIIQQKAVFEKWHQKYPDKKIIYIPLGNYIGAYKRTGKSRDEVRMDFGFLPQDTVLLSFGTVKPYKKVDNIIKVFKEVEVDSRLKLCIIGAAKEKYAEYLNSLISGYPQIVFINRFVDDAEVADILQMADYSVFWYDDSVLTSAGVNLSLSYGLPVIVRNIPAVERVKDGENGFLFDSGEELSNIFKKLPSTPKPETEKVIQSIVDDNWQKLAQVYMQFCKTL